MPWEPKTMYHPVGSKIIDESPCKSQSNLGELLSYTLNNTISSLLTNESKVIRSHFVRKLSQNVMTSRVSGLLKKGRNWEFFPEWVSWEFSHVQYLEYMIQEPKYKSSDLPRNDRSWDQMTGVCLHFVQLKRALNVCIVHSVGLTKCPSMAIEILS